MSLQNQIARKLGYEKLNKISSLGTQISVEFFLECFANPFQEIRSETIRRVSDFGRQDLTWIFAVALNDKSDFVVAEASQALAKINTDEALCLLSEAFFNSSIERPHHLANAISQFGKRGFDVLLEGTKDTSPNIRYYSAKLLGSTGFESAKVILEEMAENDNEKTSFSGLVSTAARKGLKTLLKKLGNKTL